MMTTLWWEQKLEAFDLLCMTPKCECKAHSNSPSRFNLGSRAPAHQIVDVVFPCWIVPPKFEKYIEYDDQRLLAFCGASGARFLQFCKKAFDKGDISCGWQTCDVLLYVCECLCKGAVTLSCTASLCKMSRSRCAD